MQNSEVTPADRFYEACGTLLGEQAEGTTIGRGRWRRGAGRGRFPGRGVIRWFNPKLIQVALNDPSLIATFTDELEALNAIQNALGVEYEQD